MIPELIKLSDDKMSIVVSYSKNNHLILPSMGLRALSPSAENKKNLKNPDFLKYKSVEITKIESVGNYAIRIIFNDGHNTGIYSWDFLYEIGLKIQNASNP